MKKGIVWVVVALVIILGVYFFTRGSSNSDIVVDDETKMNETKKDASIEEAAMVDETKTIIGSSVEGREITAYHYGGGDKEVLLVGGIHGGYSWNTAQVAFEAMDYFEKNPSTVPDGVKLTIVPVLNPDGLEAVVGSAERFALGDVPADREKTVPGRFNANEVDLNRNFDCDWQTNAKWQTKDVSGGTSAFSEPESRAIRDYISDVNPSAVVVWYSSAGGVFASNCHDGVLPETTELTKIFASASGYSAYQSFDFYETTGDMVNWLAKEEIPAISVLLTDHQNVEWNKNKAGIEALLKFYSK